MSSNQTFGLSVVLPVGMQLIQPNCPSPLQEKISVSSEVFPALKMLAFHFCAFDPQEGFIKEKLSPQTKKN